MTSLRGRLGSAAQGSAGCRGIRRRRDGRWESRRPTALGKGFGEGVRCRSVERAEETGAQGHRVLTRCRRRRPWNEEGFYVASCVPGADTELRALGDERHAVGHVGGAHGQVGEARRGDPRRVRIARRRGERRGSSSEEEGEQQSGLGRGVIPASRRWPTGMDEQVGEEGREDREEGSHHARFSRGAWLPLPP